MAKRFMAAFRGRTVQGLAVDLPEGYAGLVLRTPVAGKEKDADARKNEEDHARGKAKEKTKRTTRRSVLDGAADMDASNEDAAPAEEQDTRPRILQPTSTFSSFVLWHQDIPVDEGSDEYLRSLTEWTRLAAEVSMFTMV